MTISTTVFDARFAKPLDLENLKQIADHHQAVVTVEEGSIGGFGSYVLQAYNDMGVLSNGVCLKTLTLPDVYLDQDKPYNQYDAAGLNAVQIADTVINALGIKKTVSLVTNA